jgi:hypothetical protein
MTDPAQLRSLADCWIGKDPSPIAKALRQAADEIEDLKKELIATCHKLILAEDRLGAAAGRESFWKQKVDDYWLALTLIKNNGSDDAKVLKQMAKEAVE